jgi:leucyl-tRNA synthetase
VYYKTGRVSEYELLKELKKNRINKKVTDAENFLWENLKGKQLEGYKFRREHIIDRFIVDFVCLSKHLVIEIDGAYHNEPKIIEADKFRTETLNRIGYKVIRFTNEQVLNDIENVLAKIKSVLFSLPPIGGVGGGCLTVFTTRPDTIFGVTFMVLAPESKYVEMVVLPEYQQEVSAYIETAKLKTERDRMIEKKVTGVFTGSYAINPVNFEEIPIWISDYVLAGYGTGAIMAVPGHDSRDHAFAKHFNLPIIPLIEGCDVSEESFDAKEGIMINSGFLNGLTVKEAIEKAKEYIEEYDLGSIKVNYRLRDAIFSRQRYWGEPFPVYYKDGLPYMLPLDNLPLELPEVDKFLPTETGEPPLGRAKDWIYEEK